MVFHMQGDLYLQQFTDTGTDFQQRVEKEGNITWHCVNTRQISLKVEMTTVEQLRERKFAEQTFQFLNYIGGSQSCFPVKV